MILDLLGRDLLSTTVDLVLRAPLHHQVAVTPAPHDVSGTVKATVVERFGIQAAEVSADRIWTAGPEIATFSGGDQFSGVIPDLDLVARGDRMALGASA